MKWIYAFVLTVLFSAVSARALVVNIHYTPCDASETGHIVTSKTDGSGTYTQVSSLSVSSGSSVYTWSIADSAFYPSVGQGATVRVWFYQDTPSGLPGQYQDFVTGTSPTLDFKAASAYTSGDGNVTIDDETATSGFMAEIKTGQGLSYTNIFFATAQTNLYVDFGSMPCTNLPLSVTYSNNVPCTTNVIFNVTNTASYWREMAIINIDTGATYDEALVAPAGYTGNGSISSANANIYYASIPCDCSQMSRFHLYAGGQYGDAVTDTGITGQGTGPSSTNSAAGISPSQNPSGSGAPTAGYTGPVTNTVAPVAQTNNFLPTSGSVTNNIIWNNTNTDISSLPQNVKDSGQAIYNAVNTAANQAHQDAANSASQAHNDNNNQQQNNANDANGIVDAINRFHADNNQNLNTLNANAAHAAGLAHQDAQALLGALGALTNGTPNLLTNYALESSQQKALGTQVGISNMLSGFGVSSNVDGLDTNISSYVDTNGDLAGYTVSYDGPTNVADVQAQSLSLAHDAGLDTQELSFGTLASQLTDFSGDVPDFASAVPMVIDFSAYGGGTMDLDPLHTNWGQELFSVARKMFTWLIVLAYFVKVTEDGWKVVMVMIGVRGINQKEVESTVKKVG